MQQPGHASKASQKESGQEMTTGNTTYRSALKRRFWTRIAVRKGHCGVTKGSARIEGEKNESKK